MKRPRPEPAWLDHAVFYEVYPQSFYDSNGDGIGDIRGIIEKLDYIASLGCNAIWLNPCFESPFGDAGYDVSDFYKVAPRYGTNEDLYELFRLAHEKGMRVVLDLVAGHTSIEHPWFKASAEERPNRYTNWYIWTSSVWEWAPYPLQQINGYSTRDGNYVTNFFHFQPALNYGFAHPDPDKPWQLPVDHPDVQAVHAELRAIMEFWLDHGADGFRVDMASSLIRNDESKEAIVAFWQEIRGWFDQRFPEAVLVAEWSMPEIAIRAGFHIDFMIHFGTPAYTELFRSETTNDMRPQVERSGHSYFHSEGQGDIRRFLEPFLQHYEATREIGYISIPTGNHDISRLRAQRTDEELKVIYAFLLTLPGIPFIYQGDEIGQYNVDGLPSKEGGYVRTGARTPMQWDDSANAGFSTAPAEWLYLPVDPNSARPTIFAQESDPDSLLQAVRSLARLRGEHPALQGAGEFEPVFAEAGGYPFVYRRSRDGKSVLVALNPSGREVEAAVNNVKPGRLLAGAGARVEERSGAVTLVMDAVSFAIWEEA